jgi:hypothetical protein
MGGGTELVPPVIAQLAKEREILTVGRRHHSSYLKKCVKAAFGIENYANKSTL